MRLLESAPRRYDMGIRLLSLGRIDRVHAKMAELAHADERVLDVGCGTGALACLCADRGARVTGIDVSPRMLDVARERVKTAGLEGGVEVKQMSAIDLDEAFHQESFDVVVSSLMFSELSEDEQQFVLRQCHRLLREGGRLAIADEVLPRPWALRALVRLLRLPLVVLTYVLTQTTTSSVLNLEENIARAGFSVRRVERSLLGSLELILAQKTADGA